MKQVILLTCCGKKIYALIQGLRSNPKEKTYEQLKKIVGKHFSPPSSSIMNRLKFNTRVREKSESIASFVVALQQLVEFFEFGNKLNDMLRDRLVCGVNDERIQRKLQLEAKLTFETAKKLAQAAEIAEKDTRQLKRDTPRCIHQLSRKQKEEWFISTNQNRFYKVWRQSPGL